MKAYLIQGHYFTFDALIQIINHKLTCGFDTIEYAIGDIMSIGMSPTYTTNSNGYLLIDGFSANDWFEDFCDPCYDI